MNRAFADNPYWFERYIEVDKTVLSRTDISDSAKMLWMAIAKFEKYGEPPPSNAALASYLGWSISKVQQVLTKLEAAGILTRTFETADGSLHRTALRVLPTTKPSLNRPNIEDEVERLARAIQNEVERIERAIHGEIATRSGSVKPSNLP